MPLNMYFSQVILLFRLSCVLAAAAALDGEKEKTLMFTYDSRDPDRKDRLREASQLHATPTMHSQSQETPIQRRPGRPRVDKNDPQWIERHKSRRAAYNRAYHQRRREFIKASIEQGSSITSSKYHPYKYESARVKEAQMGDPKDPMVIMTRQGKRIADPQGRSKEQYLQHYYSIKNRNKYASLAREKLRKTSNPITDGTGVRRHNTKESQSRVEIDLNQPPNSSSSE